MTRLATGAAVALVGAIALGVKSLGHLERVTNQTNAVIESTGGAAGQTAASIREHAEALEQLTTADDKAIQEGQNLLLTFTKIGGKVFPKATEAVTNMAIAMAKGDVANADFKGTALQVGKALNDPLKGMTALSRAGVSFTQEQKDQVKQLVKNGKLYEAQAIILRELEVEFGNAGKAAGTGLEADMRRVEDAAEDATAALARGIMPALGRFATFLSTKLADPKVIATLDSIGRELGQAADQAIDFLEKVDFKAIGKGLGDAAGAAKTIVSTFMGLPDWVKQAVIGGWGLNKLTGGAVSTLLGGVIKGVLGMTAGVVNIKAGVVTGVGGGVPAGGKPGGVPGILGVAAPLLGVAAAIGPDPGGSSASADIGQQIFSLKRSIENASQKNADQLSVNGRETNGELVARLTERLRALESATKAAALASHRAGERVSGAARAAGVNAAAASRSAGATTAAAARTAGVTAKSGGVAAAVAIRNKRWRIQNNITVPVRTTISIRDQVQAHYKVGRYGHVSEFG